MGNIDTRAKTSRVHRRKRRRRARLNHPRTRHQAEVPPWHARGRWSRKNPGLKWCSKRIVEGCDRPNLGSSAAAVISGNRHMREHRGRGTLGGCFLVGGNQGPSRYPAVHDGVVDRMLDARVQGVPRCCCCRRCCCCCCCGLVDRHSRRCRRCCCCCCRCRCTVWV